MKRVCILLANGFEEIEAFAPYDLLIRAGVDASFVAVADVADKPTLTEQGFVVESSRKAKVIVEKCIKCLGNDIFDAILLPGGLRGSNNIKESKLAEALIKKHKQNGSIVAAECASPNVVLRKLGFFDDGTVGVCYPGLEEGFKPLLGSNGKNGICFSNNVLTTRGPLTTIEFTFELIKLLVGEDVVNELKKTTIYSDKDRV